MESRQNELEKNDQEYRSHKEVVISQHFYPEQINNINLDGVRILILDNKFVFVSPSLKNKLEETKFNYLMFSEGLSQFAE